VSCRWTAQRLFHRRPEPYSPCSVPRPYVLDHRVVQACSAMCPRLMCPPSDMAPVRCVTRLRSGRGTRLPQGSPRCHHLPHHRRPHVVLTGPAGGDPVVLEVSRLAVHYGKAQLALQDVSLTVPDGAAVAVLGANGAGKSTLMRALSGTLGHHRGTVDAGTTTAGRSAGWTPPASWPPGWSRYPKTAGSSPPSRWRRTCGPVPYWCATGPPGARAARHEAASGGRVGGRRTTRAGSVSRSHRPG
jgi:hypothetical protein